MGKYFELERFPHPVTYVFAENLLRYEAVLAVYGTQLTETRTIKCLQHVDHSGIRDI